MQRTALAAVALVLAVLVVGYGAYRIRRHFSHAAAPSPTEIPYRCVPRATPAHIPARPVVAFGDSITEGLGASRRCLALQPTDNSPKLHAANPADSTYPDDLARLTSRTILNYGYGGENTGGGLSRIRRLLRLLHPSTVLLMEGTNDLLQGKPPAEAARNIRAMIADIRRAGARPILLGVIPIEPPAHGPTGRLNQLLGQLARRDRVQIVDVGRGLTRAGYNPDGIHPNDAGYVMIARTIAQSVRL